MLGDLANWVQDVINQFGYLALIQESEEEDFTDEDENEIGDIPENLNYVDDNDIGDQDREVLNGRILGLINVF